MWPLEHAHRVNYAILGLAPRTIVVRRSLGRSFVVTCHGHFVSVAQCTRETGQHGYQVPYSGEVYVGTDFRGSPTTPGRCFNNFNEIHHFFFWPVYRVCFGEASVQESCNQFGVA